MLDDDRPVSPLTTDYARAIARELFDLSDQAAAAAAEYDSNRHPSSRPVAAYAGPTCPHGVPKAFRTTAQTSACAFCRRAGQ